MSGDAARTAVTAELDARVPDRVCCRRESARTGAALRAAESALQGTQTELVSVKRRLRQYAQTLDAVSVHAKDEIGVALQARNTALSAAASTSAERDALGQKSEGLAAALATARAEHAELKRRHDLINTALTQSVEEVSRLRRDFERAKRAANDSSAKAANLARERAQALADLSETRLARRAAVDERDALLDDLQESNTELAATKRELALVRHELATRAPPEISQNVRRDIAEGAAAAVERRTLGMIRAVAKHYMDFGLDRTEPKPVAGVPGDETDDEISEHESDSELAERIIATPPIPEINPTTVDRSTVFIAESAPDATPQDDPMSELPEADALLEMHMASIKQITVDADADTPEPPAGGALAPDTAVVSEDPTPSADAPEMIARSFALAEEEESTGPSSPVTPGNKRFSHVTQHEDEGEETQDLDIPADEPAVVYEEETPAEETVEVAADEVYEEQPVEEEATEPVAEQVYEEDTTEAIAEEYVEQPVPEETVEEVAPEENVEEAAAEVYAEETEPAVEYDEQPVAEDGVVEPTAEETTPAVEDGPVPDEVDGEEVVDEVVEDDAPVKTAPVEPANGEAIGEEVQVESVPVKQEAPVGDVNQVQQTATS